MMATQLFAAGRAHDCFEQSRRAKGEKEKKEKKERKQQNKPLFLFIYFSVYLTGSGAYPRGPDRGRGVIDSGCMWGFITDPISRNGTRNQHNRTRILHIVPNVLYY
jgi:hypothetical protein